jgi:hypothetical protein
MFNFSLMRRHAASAMIGVSAVVILISGCTGGPPPPRFTSSPTTTFTVGKRAEYSILTNDREAKVIEAGKLPVGLAISAEPGGYTLSGTPTGPGGKYVLHFTATNSGGRTSQALVLTLNQPPSFSKSYPNSIYGVVWKYDSTPIKAVSYPTPTITEQGVLPDGMTFQSFSDGTAKITGTPTILGSGGDGNITLTATNAAGSIQETMSVTVVSGQGIIGTAAGIIAAVLSG